jgi:hypothetical protein
MTFLFTYNMMSNFIKKLWVTCEICPVLSIFWNFRISSATSFGLFLICRRRRVYKKGWGVTANILTIIILSLILIYNDNTKIFSNVKQPPGSRKFESSGQFKIDSVSEWERLWFLLSAQLWFFLCAVGN